MLIKRIRGWELPESAATPEAVFHDRRRLLKGLALGPVLLSGASVLGLAACDESDQAQAKDAPPPPDPTADLYPVQRNLRYRVDRAITPEAEATTYNNFYEFGSQKRISERAQALPIRPWTVTFDGMVEKEQTVDIDELIRADAARGARLPPPLCRGVVDDRAVERLSDEVAGRFRQADLGRQIRQDDDVQESGRRDRPEGVLVSVALYRGPDHGGGDQRIGVHGDGSLRQAGAEPERRAAPPAHAMEIRLQVDQVDRALHIHRQAAESFWETIQASEYGFWANVNPKVPHPRWSQATEEVLGTGERVPTLLFNGYAEYVADLYKDLQGEHLFM